MRLRLIVLAILIVPLGALATGAALTPGTTDFLCYWTGATFVIDRLDPYDAVEWARATAGVTVDLFGVARGGNCPGSYAYPLTTAVAMIPLGAMPFGIAALIWQGIVLSATGLGVALIARAAGLRAPDGVTLMVLVAASQPFEQSLIGAQLNGVMVLGTGLLAQEARGTSFVSAGTLLALLKPHAVPFAVLLRWRQLGLVAAAAAVAPVFVLFIASLVLDTAWPIKWVNELLGQRREMFAVSTSLWTLGRIADAPLLGLALAGLAIVGLGAAARRATRLDLLDLLAIALLAWQLVVPYGLSGDQLAPLSTAWAAILRRAVLPPISSGLIVALVVIAGVVPWLLYAVRFDVLSPGGLPVTAALSPLATAILLGVAMTVRPNVARAE